MNVYEENKKKGGFIARLYYGLLERMGEKRFYPEIRSIDKTVCDNHSHNERTALNFVYARALVKTLFAIVKRIYYKLFWVEQWYLLFHFDSKLSTSAVKYRQILPPLDLFWADPHIIKNDGNYYIFVEEFSYHKKKGHISLIELDEGGNFKKSTSVLEKEFHLSYPFTFSHAGKYYMVPESSANMTIDLYECIKFPYEWQYLMHLMENVFAFDSTLFHYLNKWWLFAAMNDKSELFPMSKLYLFYSENILAQNWKPHPQNPIVSDPASARPAGRILSINGQLYRPSQNLSKSYGSGIYFNEITRLSENEYSESRTAFEMSDLSMNNNKSHTFSREGQLTVIDAYRKIPKILVKK